MKSRIILGVALANFAGFAKAEAPVIQTPSPVIYLADNLSEADKLGWCIDTIGQGYSDRLHAHSCKPRGGDVQFSYDPETKLIESVAFPGKCMNVRKADDARIPFGLAGCDETQVSQHFTYDEVTQQLAINHTPESCVAVGRESRSAGPFMSRDLVIAKCEAADQVWLQWEVR